MKASFAHAISRLTGYLDALSLRERALIFIATIAVLITLGTTLLFPPLRAKQTAIQMQLHAQRAQLQALRSQIDDMTSGKMLDADAINRKQLAELEAQFHQEVGSVPGNSLGVVNPRDMVRLVKQMLEHNRSLQLLSVESLPEKPVINNAQAAGDAQGGTTTPAGPTTDGSAVAPAQPSAILYRHALRIQLQGRYLDVLRYLQALERLPWHVYWGKVEYDTGKYPLARVTLVIYTLSLDKASIGV